MINSIPSFGSKRPVHAVQSIDTTTTTRSRLIVNVDTEVALYRAMSSGRPRHSIYLYQGLGDLVRSIDGN